MTTLTAKLPTAFPRAPATRANQAKTSLVQRLLKTLIAARERQARRIVHAHLAHHDDATLTRLGWTPAQIAALRKMQAAAAPRI